MPHRVGIEFGVLGQRPSSGRCARAANPSRRAGHDVGRTRLQAQPAMHAIEQQIVIDHVTPPRPGRVRMLDRGYRLGGLGNVGGKLGFQSRLQPSRKNHNPPTKHPGLKMPRGSNAVLSRRISANAAGGGSSKMLTPSRNSSLTRITRRLPRPRHCDLAPSHDREPHVLGILWIRGEDLRDAAPRMRAILRPAFPQTRREFRGRNRDLCAQYRVSRIEIPESLVSRDGFRVRRPLRIAHRGSHSPARSDVRPPVDCPRNPRSREAVLQTQARSPPRR